MRDEGYDGKALQEASARALPHSMEAARGVMERIDPKSRLRQLEELRVRYGLNDIEEVKEHAIEFYLQIAARRQMDYPPRLVSKISGSVVTLIVS